MHPAPRMALASGMCRRIKLRCAAGIASFGAGTRIPVQRRAWMEDAGDHDVVIRPIEGARLCISHVKTDGAAMSAISPTILVI